MGFHPFELIQINGIRQRILKLMCSNSAGMPLVSRAQVFIEADTFQEGVSSWKENPSSINE